MGAVGFVTQLVRVVRGALSRHHVVKVRLAEQVEAVIYDRPGEWMSDVELDRLRRDIQFVAGAGVPGQLQYGVFLPERKPFTNRLVVIGRHLANQEVIGFNAMPMLELSLPARGVTVLHLGVLIIHPKYRRQGYQGLLYGLGGFSAVHRLPGSPVWMSNVTEVPAVFGAVAESFGEVFPHFEKKGPPPPAHREIAEAIMRDHRHEFGVGAEAGFDAERFVIQGSYTGGSDALKKTFDSAPKHRRLEANAFCQAQLDYRRGDDFLQIGQIDAGIVANYLSRRIPAPLRPAAARRMRHWTYPARSPT